MLWLWLKSVSEGDIERRDGSIILMTSQLTELWRWDFTGAYPVAWSGPVFNANASAVAIEQIEFVHRGIWKSFAIGGGLGASALGSIGGAVAGSISGGISL